MIKFRLLDKFELSKFVQSQEFDELPVIPITRHRALSHINNPRLQGNEILLILALEENLMVGYLGILPDYLFINDDQFIKCGWLSCFWVDPMKRGQGIGEGLIKKALECWNKSLLSADYVRSTKRVYDKSNEFANAETIYGIRLYYRSDLHCILPPKKVIFKRTVLLLNILDKLINSVTDLRYFFYKTKPAEIKVHFIGNIDKELEVFINELQKGELFKRGKIEFDWILKYPWILEYLSKTKQTQQYFFSSYEKRFTYFLVKLVDNLDNIIAFVMLCQRNLSLKMPYCYVKKEHVPGVINFLEQFIINHKITTFTTFHADTVQYLSEFRSVALYGKRIERKYLITKRISELVPGLGKKVQDGDGDQAFT